MHRLMGAGIVLFCALLLIPQAWAFSDSLDVFATYPWGETDADRTNAHVSFGYPFEPGKATSVNTLSIAGASAQQFRITGRHPDGSISWVLADFILSGNMTPGQVISGTYALTNTGSGSTSGTICNQSGGVISVNTGSPNGITAEVVQNNFNILNKVTLNDGGNTPLVVANNDGGVLFTDESGLEHSSKTTNATRFEIQDNGAVRCSVVVEGLIGTSGVGYRVILDFIKDSADVKITTSYRNAFFSSQTHKVSRGARFRIDTTLEGTTVTSETPAGDGSAFTFTVDPTQQVVLSTFDNDKHTVQNHGSLGIPPASGQGYAVQLYPSAGGSPTDVIARTPSTIIPTYQWLKATSGTKKILLTGRYLPYFYPDGLSYDASNGHFSYDVVPSTYPNQPAIALPWRSYKTREGMIHFNPAGNSTDIVKRFTNKLIFIPTDRTLFGKAGGFYPATFDTISYSTLQQFYDRPDTPITGNMCAAPSNVKVDFLVWASIPTGQSGGGVSNNEERNMPQETFTAGNRFGYAYYEQLARYRADIDQDYLDDKIFTYPKTNQMKVDFEKKASNDAQVKTQFPSLNYESGDEAHNWSFQINHAFYNFTGREEFRKAMDGQVIWWWLNGFQWQNYLRPMGMFLQAQAHSLEYLSETNDPRYSDHETFVTNYLKSTVVYSQSVPSYGYYSTWQGKSSSIVCNFDNPATPQKETNLCFGFHAAGKGWWAAPGEKIDKSVWQPEVQDIDFDVDTFYSSDGVELCQEGARWWMITSRFTFGLIQLFNVYSLLEPDDPVLINDIGLRVVDAAKMLSGNEIGGGAYKNDFSNPKNSTGNYQFCPMNKTFSVPGPPSTSGTGNGYLGSFIYTFAAEHAATSAEKAWWHNIAMNELFAISANAYPGETGFTCYSEFDPRAQYSIEKFIEWGGNYTPSNYAQGTPYPDPGATFNVSTVIPGTVNKGFDTPMVVNGSLFTNTDKVEIGNPVVLSISPTFVNSGQLSFTLTAAQSNTLGVGTFDVRVKQGSTYSNSKPLTVQLLTPTLSAINPSAITTGSSSQLFTLTGTNFQNGAQVKVGTLSLLSTTYVSSTQLSFTLSTANIAALGVGNFDVYVQNPDTGKSGNQTLSILAPGSPLLVSYSPIDIEYNTGPTTITLNGSNLQSGVQAWLLSAFNGSLYKMYATTLVNSGQVTFVVPLSDTTSVLGPGLFNVFVTNPDGKISNVIPNFAIYVPYILTLSPNAVTNEFPVTLEFTGYYFKNGAKILIGNTSFTPTTNTGTTATLNLTPAQLLLVGNGDKTVYIQNPAGGQSLPWTLTISPPSNSGGNNNNVTTGGGGGASEGGGGAAGGGAGGGGGSGGSDGPTCVATLELCDSIDNDCDGVVDNGCDVSIIESGIIDCSNPQAAAENGFDCGSLQSTMSVNQLDAFAVFVATLNLMAGILQIVFGPV